MADRRSLSHALFIERAVQQVVSGESFTISVEVTAFEHVERAGRHYGAVQLRYEVDDNQRVVATEVITIERESESADIARVVAAISSALSAASAEAADAIVARLSQAP